MLSTVYQKFSTSEYNEDCPICIKPMLGKPARAHPGDGQKHPLCYDCAIEIIRQYGKCPSCRVLIKNEVSWKDSCTVELKEIGKDIGKGLAFGFSFLVSAQVLITGLKVSSEIMEKMLDPILEKTPLIPLLSTITVVNIIGKKDFIPSLMGGLSAAFIGASLSGFIGASLSPMMGGAAVIVVGVFSGNFVKRNILKLSSLT